MYPSRPKMEAPPCGSHPFEGITSHEIYSSLTCCRLLLHSCMHVQSVSASHISSKSCHKVFLSFAIWSRKDRNASESEQKEISIGIKRKARFPSFYIQILLEPTEWKENSQSSWHVQTCTLSF